MSEAMQAAWISGLASGAGAIVGGALAIFAAVLAFRMALAALETQELRKEQVHCIVRLYSLRTAMAPNPASLTRQEFLNELNKIGVLFASSTSVQNALRSFRTNRSNPNFITLVRECCKEAKVDASGLTNDDVEGVFL